MGVKHIGQCVVRPRQGSLLLGLTDQVYLDLKNGKIVSMERAHQRSGSRSSKRERALAYLGCKK
jgi:hypothetical protein